MSQASVLQEIKSVLAEEIQADETSAKHVRRLSVNQRLMNLVVMLDPTQLSPQELEKIADADGFLMYLQEMETDLLTIIADEGNNFKNSAAVQWLTANAMSLIRYARRGYIETQQLKARRHVPQETLPQDHLEHVLGHPV